MFVPPKLVAELAEALELMARTYPDIGITMVAYPKDSPEKAAFISNVELEISKDNLRHLLNGENGKVFTFTRETH